MSGRKSERDAALVEVWCDRIKDGYDAKKEFAAAAAETDAYFKGGADPFFESDALKEFLDVTHCPKVTINSAFQIRGWLAPNLYQRNPTRTVTSRTKDSILDRLGRVLSAYLNYTPHEAGLADESRMAIDESLLSGRSCVYTGYRDSLGLVTSWFVSVDDVVIDPTARRPRDAYWIAIRRRLPRWELEREFPEASDLSENLGGDSLADGSESGPRRLTDPLRPKQDAEEEDEDDDCVTFYEVYSRMGIGWRGAEVDEELANPDDSFDYRKLVIVDGHPKPLYVGRWETPLYVDEVWPLSFLDLTPTKNSLWPVSLMKAALPSQRAVNLLASISLEKAKQHAREIYGISAQLSDEDKERIVSGGLSEVIELKSNDPGMTVQQLVQRWESGVISPEIREQLQFHIQQIGEVTGLLPILKGQSSEQQIRSATEADIRDRNARSRLQDLNERVEDWATRVARNEGLVVRMTLDADEVSKYVDASIDLDLGFRLVVSSFGVPLPTRLHAPGSSVDPAKEEPCLQGLAPAFARYFDTEEEAAMAAQAFVANLEQFRSDFMIRTGKPIFVDNVTVERVRVEDVWIDTAYLSAADLAREVAFRVETGSTKRPDANKAIDQANTLMQAVAQPALQLGDFQTYNACLKAVYESQGYPPHMRVYLQPPPPPPPMAPQGGPPGAPAGPAAAPPEPAMAMEGGGTA